MKSEILIFSEPETFDLVPLALRRGRSVAVEYDGQEAEALRDLLAQFDPQSLGPCVIGTAATQHFLLENNGHTAIRIRSRADLFAQLHLNLANLPVEEQEAIAEALWLTRDYFDQFV